ncbi:hypothetical protein KRR40_41845 [Niabella defluvii]|nr:hypothetical protein KRR40_41845 [Niabella sp. I65]
MMRSGVLVAVAIVLLMPLMGRSQPKALQPAIQKSVLWEQGKGRYKNYRIPAIVVTKKERCLRSVKPGSRRYR